MIQIDVEQGSPEWLAVRLGIPTASQFHRIMTSKTMKPSSSSKNYLYELLAEWLIQEPLDDKKSQFMERGNELEQMAVNYYEFQKDIETEIVGFCLRDDRMVGCSPDRFIGNDGGLEIKCPSAKTHVQYLVTGTLSDEYRLQVQGNLWITGRQWWDIISYNPVLPPALIRCERDEKYISILSGLVDALVAQLQAAKLSLSEKGITPINENTKQEL